MRQVPSETASLSYFIIGNGKLAKHIIYYFQLLEVEYSHWHRKSAQPLSSFNLNNKKILILINDDAIIDFIAEHEFNKLYNSILIHCSGILNTTLALGMHPLMTFSDNLYDLDTYKSIPFVVDSSEIDIQKVFPEFMNRFYKIPLEKKELYHTWCSIAGNFTSLLWMNCFNVFKNEFGFEKEILIPYMTKIFENIENIEDPLTGPLKRGDNKTIEKHLKNVENTPFHDMYTSFIKIYKKQKSYS